MTDTIDLPRSKRLKALTHEVHDRLDKSIMEASSFDSLEGYGRFAGVQWTFHRDIDALYDDAALIALLPGLAERRRMALIATDLADLGRATPGVETAPVFQRDQPADVATALGWLYVAEGSNLGAALLRKEAAKLGLSDSHGARHLAPSGGGPAAHWRVFTAALDAAVLTPDEEARAVAGAKAAFARVQALANAALR
ncbi:biliverdin-producing heme oxygenase [Brevundimonas nasdae]|uniref:biliverdin-producing heme oxygenase n=1 Tax=Brevundimonas nasdae TaxID=172043 RepID=UPI002897DDAD|nr:biliverdin-producing heme oxygenase [Brevundimonas nasdae]